MNTPCCRPRPGLKHDGAGSGGDPESFGNASPAFRFRENDTR